MTNDKRILMVAAAAAIAVFAIETAVLAAPSVLRPAASGNSGPKFQPRQPGAPLRRPATGVGQSVAQPKNSESQNAVAEASAAGGEGAAGASDLNFKDAPGDMVFEVYGKLVGRTVLKDPQTPNATITLQSLPGQKLTKEDQIRAIETVMEMNGVHFEPYGEKFVRALPRKDARKVGIPLITDQSAEPLDEVENVVSMMIDFKNIPVDEAQKALEGFKSNSGLLQVFERTNKILVTDSQMNINRMIEIARAIDISSPVLENVYVRQIKYAAASDIKTALEQIVTESQKEQEKNGKTQQNAGAQNATRMGMLSAGSTPLLRRPGAPGAGQPSEPTSVESLVTSVSDADRGMIRGKVLIIADERSNKLIVVTMKSNMDFFDKVLEQLDVPTTPDVQVKVYRLKYAEAEDVADMINDLIGNSASSKSTSKQPSGAAGGSNANLTRSNPSPGASRPSVNQRGGGQSKAGELSKENVTVLADKRINGLVVMARTEDIPALEQIIESMDIKLSQVLIETAIIEVTLGDDLAMGIDWVMRGKSKTQVPATDRYGRKLYYALDSDNNVVPGVFGAVGQKIVSGESSYTITENVPVMTSQTIRDNFVNNGSFGLGGGGGSGSVVLQTMMNVVTNATDSFFNGANPIGGGINYLLKSDKLNLAAVIQASKSDSRAKYLASPIVMTVDNKEATIDATESRKFFAGYETSSSYSTYVRTPKYDSKDIGIKIKVKPKINPNGTVMLNVEEEYSQLGAGQTIIVDNGNGGQGTAVIDTALTRKMTADVLLDNHQSIVLGGLTERYTSQKETGIPILKDIPWIGRWLFGSVTESEVRKELLVFMTPYVLDDADSAQAEALRRKRSMSDSKPWDDNGWSDSELADPVSKKELLRRLKDEAEKQDEERRNRLAVEKWKLDRAKALEKMDEAERKFWIEQHREELEKEEKKEFDRQVKEQEDLRKLVKSIREKDMKKAEEKIKTSDEEEKKAGKEVEEGRTDVASKEEKDVKEVPAAAVVGEKDKKDGED